MKYFISFYLILTLILSASFSNAQNTQRVIHGIDAESKVVGAEQIILNNQNNSVSFIKMKNGSFVEEQKHLDWLKTNVLKTENDYGLILYRKEKDYLGYTHYRYKITYKGIAVEHSVYYVHTKDGKVVSVNGEFYPNLGKKLPSINAQITPSEALITAKRNFNSKEVNIQSALNPSLSIIHVNNSPYLCYSFNLSSDKPLKHVEVYVDAQSNKIVLELNKIHTVDVPGTATTQFNGTKNITIDQVSSSQFRLQESGRNIYTKNCSNGTNKTSTSDFTNTSVNWIASTIKDKAVYDLHYGLEKSYDYYSNKFSRLSYDNLGTQIKGIAHYDINFSNAFWDGTYLVFGDGDGSSYLPFSPTDIVGHEFTHAVTESSAGLVYMNESGALNESFSDIFGVAIDFFANPASANFLEGEQCSTSNTPFRNMINPNATYQPDTYLGTYWVPSGGSDNGGVHTNSQIQNHWFYLLCQGGTGTNDNGVSYNITGIGISDAEKIAYRNLTNYLTPNSTFNDARTYAIQSAIDLFGYCSNNVTQCANAWYAVGVGSGYYSNSIVANFSANNFSCVVPAVISFTNTSINASGAIWDFGDGSTSNTLNPSHTYTSAGIYSVKLKSVGTSSCNTTDSITKPNYITITNAGSPISACYSTIGNTSSYYGITKVEFGTISNTSNNATEGVYKDYTCTQQASLIAGNPYLLKVTTASQSEKVTAWIDYNNDGTFNSSNEMIMLSYNVNNNITTHTIVVQTPANAVTGTPLRLRVFDDYVSNTNACASHNYGQTEDYTIRFTSSSTKPIANFFSDKKVLNVNGSVNFSDSTLNGPTIWKWTFQGGNPTTSSVQNPTVVYPSVGTYSVKLVASNAFGSDSITKIAYINVVPIFNMCSTTNSTSTLNGYIYDPGGPSGQYGNSQNCEFLINTGCTGTVSLTFSQFSTESCCDYLSVYNGTNTSAPFLGTFKGSSIPPTLYANSGAMLLKWYTDGSVVYDGFAASWSSVISGSLAPVAGFSVSNTNPPLGTSVQFTDQTINSPNQWLWEFGDGSTSNSKNPLKSYNTPGIKTITLTATNCTSSSITTKTLLVQNSPSLTIAPNPITASVSCGGSVSVTATISNSGSGDLQYSIQNQSTPTSINLLYLNSLSTPSENNNVTNILSGISNCSVTTHTLTNVTNFESALLNKQILLIPEVSIGTLTSFTSSINNFVNNGGTLIINGNNTSTHNELGFFSISSYSTTSVGVMSVLDTTDAITKNLPLNISTLNATYYYTFSNSSNVINLVTYSGYPVVFKKSFGQGKVIGIGYDYFQTDINASKILSNAIKNSAVSVSWLTISPTSGTVSPAGSNTLSLQFNSNNLVAGTYTTNLLINSNYQATPNYSLPISYTVYGTPSSSVSATCKSFGNIMQYTNKIDSLVLYNTGCSTMSVSSLSTSNSVYTYTPSTSFTVAPFASRKIYLKFSPTTVGIINDTLGIINNGGNQKICLSGTVTSAPQISVTPTAISESVSCGGIATTTLYVSNNGGSNLTYTISNNKQNTIKVLVISNLTYPLYISNIQNALNSYSVNYTLTYHNLTTVSALQTALADKNIVIFPQPYNGSSSYSNGYFQPYSSTIYNFVNNGGTAVMSGFYSTNMVNDLGLFNSTYNGYISYGSTYNITDTNNVITRGLPLGIATANNYYYYNTFSNPDVINYASYLSTNNIISSRNIGSGKAIYLAYDYEGTIDVNFNKVIANCVKSSYSPTNWLSGSITSNTVIPGNTSSVSYTLNSSGLASGTYTDVITITSNDPLSTTYTVPVSFTVSGTPSSSVSSNCKNFGSVVQYTNKKDSLFIYNTSCATMSVSSLYTSNSAYTYTPSTSFTIAPFANRKIYLKFSPTTVGIINDTLRIITNGGNQNVCLSGTVTSAPSISVSPNSFSVNLSACNSSSVVTMQISNTGGSNLSYSITGSSLTNSVNVLVITNYVDMTGEYVNTINSINSYFTGYNLTPHSLSSVPAFETALTGKHVLLIPEQETYVAGFMQTYSTSINTFISNGGTAIFCGNNNTSQINDIGQFNTSYVSDYSSVNVNVIDTNDVIMRGVPMTSFYSPNGTYTGAFTNSGITNYITYGSNSVVCKKTNSLGRAIYLASDFYTINTNFSKIIANSIKSSTGALPNWLSLSSTSSTVNPGGSSSISFTVNSGNYSAGTYTSSLIINSNDPFTPSYTVPINMIVGSNPCANFNYTNSNNCTGIVTFTNTTVNNASSYSWNFGNGTSSSSTNPSVTYMSSGNYSVTLTACTNGSCSSITKTLVINGVGGPITNTCSPTSYSYSSNYGILNVSLNTINKSSGYASIEGYQDFSCANQTTLTVGQVYTLTINTSPYYYENCAIWIDFDNNGVFSSSEQIMNSYNKLASHTLTFTPNTAILNTPLRMRVIDEYNSYTITSACYNSYYGQTEDYTIKIQPNNTPPVAAFNTNINSCSGTVNFIDNSLNSPTSWIWNFGDGNASSLQNPTYTYTTAGTYTVLLIASNMYGTNYTSQVVSVNPLSFNIGINGNMITGQPLTYTTNLNGGISYTWDFGDGTLSGQQTATHSYSAAGTYTVKLTAISGGCVNTVTTSIIISNVMGVENTSQLFSLSAYPNPFNNYSDINLNLKEDLTLEIEILNALGQKIKTLGEKRLYEKGEYQFSTEYLSSGIYFLKINYNKSFYIYKLISFN